MALGLTALGDTQAQAQRTDPRKHSRLVPAHDATELRVLDWALWNVSKYYVEPERIDPQQMTLAGLEALENAVAEVLVKPVGKGKRVKVRVGTEEREFQIGDVEALWAVGPHVREVFRFINRNTEMTEEEQRKAEYAIVAGVLGTLDPHTNLLRPDDFADMKASTKGSFGGLGIEVGMRDGAITVIRVIDGNPASKVDMQPGDRIVQIDAESTVTMTLNEAVGRLRGPPGTTVTCYVMRDGLESPKKLPITRATIKLDSVIGDIMTNTEADGTVRKVGLVQIPRNFAQTTGKELRAKLDEFEREGVEGVILDLRDNPGGLLNAAVEVADAFLSSGTIVSTVGVSSPREESKADERYDFPQKPLVVLVDQGSASASEIVAGALRNPRPRGGGGAADVRQGLGAGAARAQGRRQGARAEADHRPVPDAGRRVDPVGGREPRPGDGAGVGRRGADLLLRHRAVRPAAGGVAGRSPRVVDGQGPEDQLRAPALPRPRVGGAEEGERAVPQEGLEQGAEADQAAAGGSGGPDRAGPDPVGAELGSGGPALQDGRFRVHAAGRGAGAHRDGASPHAGWTGRAGPSPPGARTPGSR